VVLSIEEVRAVMHRLHGTSRIMLELVYGAGLRLNELVTLRVKDIDFEAGTITLRSAKGDQDRVTLMPRRVRPSLSNHLEAVKRLHERDLTVGAGAVLLPHALRRKYPNAEREWRWQFAFPSATLAPDPDGKMIRRWHVSPSTVQKGMKSAVSQAGIAKPASVHTLRHQLRNPSAPEGSRHTAHPGALGTQERRDNHDLYTCIAIHRTRCWESPGRLVTLGVAHASIVLRKLERNLSIPTTSKWGSPFGICFSSLPNECVTSGCHRRSLHLVIPPHGRQICQAAPA
jgi:integrase